MPEIIHCDVLTVSGVLRVCLRITISCFARVVLC
jgi:hypothetical protein